MQHKCCWQAVMMNRCYFQLRSQQWGWRCAMEGLAWHLQMRPQGGMAGRAGHCSCTGLLHWALASFWWLQRGRLTTWLGSSLSHSGGINQLGFESYWIIWLLLLQVPPVESKLSLPGGKTENVQDFLVHFMQTEQQGQNKHNRAEHVSLDVKKKRSSGINLEMGCNNFTVMCQCI